MSDSEEDMLPNNVFTFQNENTIISARGPGINKSNLTGLSFRSNVLTSTLNMPGSFPRYKFGVPQYDQRSLHYGRETSPMSMRSDIGPRSIHNSYYPRAMSSQRSVINGRSGSPMSVRSTDTTASVSAIDIAHAFKYMNFNKHELKIIKDAYNKLIRNKVRKRIEKRRNLKLFLRGVRRKSGYDSGEQGSDSSISSDDCPSVKTTASYKSGMLRQQINKIDKSLLRTSIKETDIYNDRTEQIKQNSLRNIFSIPPKAPRNVLNGHNILNNSDEIQEDEAECRNSTLQNSQNNTMTLKERFTKGFLLPSQRFNQQKNGKTNGSVNIQQKVSGKTNNNVNLDNESDEEQIFPDMGLRRNGTLNGHLQKKRCLDEGDINSGSKKTKLDVRPIQEKSIDENHLDFPDDKFTFKKPSMPVRKSHKSKKEDMEILISKSAQTLDHEIVENSEKLHPTVEEPENNHTELSQTGSDVSMKPSFIKRKLFTQNLDLLDKKNLSTDNLAAPSPQAKSLACKEKNKTRKLVTSQSCLSRDVVDDDNNVLDLIHKIVPADQMNLTNGSKRLNKSKSAPAEDKWDVTSVVSLCNSAEGSDTFTDEEIFNVQNNVKKAANNNKKPDSNQTKLSPKKPLQTKNCKVMLKDVVESQKEFFSKMLSQNQKTVSISVKSFWDTDLESDIEGTSIPAWKQKATVNQVKDTIKEVANGIASKQEKKNVKGSILTVRGSQNKVNNKTILNETKQYIKCPPKTTTRDKEDTQNTKKSKTTQQQTKKDSQVSESVLNTTRTTRNVKKNMDCTSCENVLNSSNNVTTVKKRGRPKKINTTIQESIPKESKILTKNNAKTKKKNNSQALLNNTQESDSSINISSRSLRSRKRLDNSKENLSPIEPKLTRSWSKNTSKL